MSGVLAIYRGSTSNSIRHLEEHAKAVAAQLNRMGVRYAVVGGIPVSFRAVVRTTNDLDLAVFVVDDAEAESIVRKLIGLGYRAEVILESDVSGRLATVRMISAGEREVFVDLLFASTGIERGLVEGSSMIEIFPGLALHVASRPALIASRLSRLTRKRVQKIPPTSRIYWPHLLPRNFKNPAGC